MWGDDEVPFQDWKRLEEDPNIRKRRGYQKVASFCDLARKESFAWAWSDTCCIDQTSSSELSHAINSMFHWYRDAAVCFAYLADFEAKSETTFATEGWMSRWFTRGWTLQELLAPENVVFYDRTWRDFGTKKSLAPVIEDITCIDRKVLLGERAIHEFTAAQRLSWAAYRETSRPEDIAYCLMGLFNVNMPLLYGEKENAFLRLQQEIIRAHPDLSLLAWVSEPNGFYSGQKNQGGILATSPMDFKSASHITRSPSAEASQASRSLTFTNQGIFMKLPIIRRGDSTFGILDCVHLKFPGAKIAINLEETEVLPSGELCCRRVSHHHLEKVELTAPATVTDVLLSPIFVRDHEPTSRFQRIGISLHKDFGQWRGSLIWSEFSAQQRASERIMIYFFRADLEPPTTFGVKVQWRELSTKLSAIVEIKVGKEDEIQRWSSRRIELGTDEAEAMAKEEPVLKISARLRYGAHQMGNGHSGLKIKLHIRVS